MTDDRSDPTSVWNPRRFTDLLAVVSVLALTVLCVFAPIVRETPLRPVFGLVFVLFVPGYAVLAALFPAIEGGASTGVEGQPPAAGRISGIERIVFSVGLSIVVASVVGLVASVTPVGIGPATVVAGGGGVTLVATLVAARRRAALPGGTEPISGFRTGNLVPSSGTRTDRAITLVLVVSMLVAVVGAGYVAVQSNPGQTTEFYLLTTNESGGLVADDYPTEFTRGEEKSVVVGIENHERTSSNYTVMVQLQNVSVSGEGDVTQKQELERFSTRLDAGETQHTTVRLQPTMAGERLRVTFLLFRGDQPGKGATAQETHLWIEVSERV